MTTQKMKVYELAKDLGMESTVLVERLRQLDIDVKSHMSSLGTEELRIARDHFDKEKVQADRAQKAAATKKAASLDKDEKRVTSTVIRRRQKAGSGADGDGIMEAAPVATTTAPSTIRRRKAVTTVSDEGTALSGTNAGSALANEVHVPAAMDASTQSEDTSAHLQHAQEDVVISAAETVASHQDQTLATEASAPESAPEHSSMEAAPKEEALAIQEPTPVDRPMVTSGSAGPGKAPSIKATGAARAPVGTKPQGPGISPSGPEKVVLAKPTAGSSFDIIKVIPKEAPKPRTVEPVRIITTPTMNNRPKPQIQVVQKANPAMVPPVRPLRPGEGPGSRYSSRYSSGFQNRGPGGPGGYSGPGGPGGYRPGGPGGFAPRGPGLGRGPVGGGFTPPLPPLGGNIGGRHSGDHRRHVNLEEDFNKKKTGLTAREREDLPIEDVRLLDYRAKKELVFIGKKKKAPITRDTKMTEITTPAAHKRVIKVEGAVTVADLANRMGIKSQELIKKLMATGVMAGLNHSLDFDTATLIAGDFGFSLENVAFKEESVIQTSADADELLQSRPPIVTVMGHVDHGKTSLLDAIRSAEVAAGEAGGITQHIGAYTVSIDGKPITFIDTPGHEAFTMMRARGANVTDIVILVVAADDGIMPQTREAIDHARSAQVPIIVAINKMDKPTANRDKVLKALAELDLLAEEWGGQTMVVNVSALKKTGIKELLEGILLQAEVLDLKANPDRLAEGTILEAKLDRNRGAVATVLVKRGTLNVGDNLVAGTFTGRVRAMMGAQGESLKTISPSMAAEILGLDGVPTAGDNFNAVASEAEGRELQAHRIEENRRREAAKNSKLSLEQIFGKIQKGDLKELPLILKTDVYGSTEAIKESLTKLSTAKVKVKILSAAVGGITESDVLLAGASQALILGFNVRPDTKARALAESEHIEIKTYAIIYELIDDVKKAMTGLLPKQAVERYLGRAEVRSLFNIPGGGVVAGCGVIDGKIQRSASVRLLRENRVIYTGKISSLRRFKDDAKEVAQGYECGIAIENYRDVKAGDVIEAFTIDMVAQELDQPLSAGQANTGV